MKRENVKAKIPGITDDQLDWLMGENGGDITREKNATAALRAELETANTTIAELQNTAKAFEGVDVEGLKSQLATLQEKYDTDLASLRLGSAIDLALTSNKAKNRKAARALLDLEEVKLEGDKVVGLDEQLEALKKSDPWLFEAADPADDGAAPGIFVSTGTEHGTGGQAGADDGVAAAFAALNPDLKL